MSKPSKPRSGLSTVTRNFEMTQASQSSQLSQEIPWSSSPPVQRPVAKALTPQEIRLKLIEEAVAAHQAEGNGKRSAIPPLAQSSAQNKRPSPSSNDERAVKRPRQLPTNWSTTTATNSSLSAQNESSSSYFSRSRSQSVANALSGADSSTKPKLASIFLSQEQTQILKLAKDGDSLFYTGSAGTGKSVLLREIIKALRKKHANSPDAVAITASTGIAACNIGGITIHSFAGIGLGADPVKDLITKIKKNKKSTTRWLRTKVLIIDEVSMVDGDLFDKLAKIGSEVRRRPEPFGGIQVIVTGDFFQLPPVGKNDTSIKFAFEAQTWSATVKHTYNLTKVFRQSDQTFVDMLNEMRFGTLTEKSIQKFKYLSRPIVYDDGIGATELYPMRNEVQRSNDDRLRRLTTQGQTYVSVDSGSMFRQSKEQAEKSLQNFMSPKQLDLRVDAQVMLIKNHDDTLVNGSMGRVIRFVDPAIYSTEDDTEAMPGEVGVIGAATAVTGVGSAVKKPKGSASVSTAKPYPVVEFVLPQGGKRRMLVMCEVWKVEDPSGEVLLSRTQLPLLLSWAMSIHKSQGQTLDRVKVDLNKIFEKGQAYVALSRATNLDGLQVLNFNKDKIMAHPKVIHWSKSLSTILDS